LETIGISFTVAILVFEDWLFANYRRSVALFDVILPFCVVWYRFCNSYAENWCVAL